MPENILSIGANAPVSLTELLINLAIGVAMAIVIRWHFQRFGSTLSNRAEFAQVFPLVLLTTILIISVVKSSLALSLGLVGALSIVRFRTPIKEPEELAYLFISIAMGLGLGANQTLTTVVAGLFILVVMAFLKMSRTTPGGKRLFLSLDWPDAGTDSSGKMKEISQVITNHVPSSDLRRFDVRDDMLAATYMLDATDPDKVSAMVDELRSQFPKMGVTFLDQNQMPGI